MKLLFKALFVSALSLSLHSFGFAQKTALPSGLTDNSSLKEVLNWIDRTSLPEARIGLESNVPSPEPDEIPTAYTRYYEWAFFSKGFRLAKIDVCKITLRNDNVELIRFETKYPDPAKGSLEEFRKIQDEQSQFTAEFSILLQELKANKPPYRHTKIGEKAALLGTWRTEFKEIFEFFLFPTKKKMKSLVENHKEDEVISLSVGQDGRNESMTGDEITFTFDDKQMSENFYSAFSRAIALCKAK